MSDTIFTFPGKLGDSIMEWPVAWWWANQTGKRFVCWMDEKSTKLLKPLFEAQPCVERVEFKPGVVNYECGGQPWHFDLPTSEYEGKNVYHLGFRSFPSRQITLETMENARVPIKVDQQNLADTPTFEVGEVDFKNRLVLHGQATFRHTRTSPGFWKFLFRVRGKLESLFDEIVWVGSARDREVGRRTYPDWPEFDDEGDFLKLARVIAGSKAVIGVGSSVVTLAGALKVPCIRVHDPMGDKPKVIWSNLGDNQLNATEEELREMWQDGSDLRLEGAKT